MNAFPLAQNTLRSFRVALILLSALPMMPLQAADPQPLHVSLNTNTITINDNSPAAPFPSTIEVTNLTGRVTAVRVTLHDFSHAYPSDAGVLLEDPAGNKVVLMNRAGGRQAVTNLTLTFDQSASNAIPYTGSPLVSGSYRPADYRSSLSYSFLPPAPSGPYTNTLEVCVGYNPNGLWKLYVQDDMAIDSGLVGGGWMLELTAAAASTNARPSIVLSTNAVVATVGVVSEIISAAVSDAETPPDALRIEVSSSNTNVVSPDWVFFSGTGSSRQFTVAPVGPGTARLTLAVGDGAATNSTELIVNALPAPGLTFLSVGRFQMTANQLTVVGVTGMIAKASVSIFGLEKKLSNALDIGLYHQWPYEISLVEGSWLTGALNYAQVTFDENSAIPSLPLGESLTNMVVQPDGWLRSLVGMPANGNWMINFTNRPPGTPGQFRGWTLRLHMAPTIINRSNNVVAALAGYTLPIHMEVFDEDGYITNLNASIPAHPAAATITTSYDGAEGIVYLTGSASHSGQHTVQVVATDNEGFSTTNSFGFLVVAAPTIGVGPSAGFFGFIPVGQTSSQTFYVTNMGGGYLIGSASVAYPYSIVSGSQYNLPPGWSQPIVVRYTPGAPATNFSFLKLTGGAGMNVPLYAIAYMSFEVASVLVSRDSLAEVPIRVGAGFTNISLFQFSLYWDPAKLEFSAVDKLKLPGLSIENFGYSRVTNGMLTVSWDEPSGSCLSLTNGTDLFNVRFVARAEVGTTNYVRVSNAPVELEAADCQLRPVPVNISMGSVQVTRAGFQVSGKVGQYATGPLPGVEIRISGTTNLPPAITSPQGVYETTLPASGTYILTPTKTQDAPITRGVTTLDLPLIRRHLLGTATLDTPYQLLAADVDGSHSISTLDVSHVRRFILGFSTSLPAGLWRFVPHDYVFPAPSAPWYAPGERRYTNLVTDVPQQDFVAIKLGDVNNSWFGSGSLAARKLGEGVPVRLRVSRHSAIKGAMVPVRITTAVCEKLTTSQFTVKWDPGVLRYSGVRDLNVRGLTEGNFGTRLIDEGRLTFAWDDPETMGVSLPEETALFSVLFEVIGAVGSASVVELTDDPTVREASVNLALAALETSPGGVTVIPSEPPMSYNLDTAQGVLSLSFPTELGASYTIETAVSLTAPEWTPVAELNGDGTTRTWSNAGVTNAQRFYRLRTK